MAEAANIGRKFSEITLDNYPSSERVAGDKEPIVVRNRKNVPIGMLLGDGVSMIKNLAFIMGTLPSRREDAIDVTYAGLLALRETGQLAVGRYYRITDYRAKKRVHYTDDIFTAAEPEPLLFTALDAGTLSEFGESDLYEGEVVKLDFTDNTLEPPVTAGLDESGVDLTRTGRMVYRHDPVRNITAEEDYRGLRNRRWMIKGFQNAPATYDAASNHLEVSITTEYNRAANLNSEILLSAMANVSENRWSFTTVPTHGLAVGDQVLIYDKVSQSHIESTVAVVGSTRIVQVDVVGLPLAERTFADVYVVNPNLYTEYLISVPDVAITTNPRLTITTPNGVQRSYVLKTVANASSTSALLRNKKICVYFSKAFGTYVFFDNTAWNNAAIGYRSCAPTNAWKVLDWGALNTPSSSVMLPWDIDPNDWQEFPTFADIDQVRDTQLRTIYSIGSRKQRYSNMVFMGSVEGFNPNECYGSFFGSWVKMKGTCRFINAAVVDERFDFTPIEHQYGIEAAQILHADKRGDRLLEYITADTLTHASIFLGSGQYPINAGAMNGVYSSAVVRIGNNSTPFARGKVNGLRSSVLQGSWVDCEIPKVLTSTWFEQNCSLAFCSFTGLKTKQLVSVQKTGASLVLGAQENI